MTVDLQLAELGSEWPRLSASVLARSDDDLRWRRFNDLVQAGRRFPARERNGRRAVATLAAIGVLEDIADRWTPSRAAKALGGAAARGATALDIAAAPSLDDPDVLAGWVAVDLLVRHADEAPVDARARTGEGLFDRLERLRLDRPWPSNPVFTNLAGGTYSPQQALVFIREWQHHLRAGSTLFAGLLSRAERDDDSVILLANLLGDAGINRRIGLAEELQVLASCVAPGDDLIAADPLLETVAHIGLMRSVTRHRSFVEGCAAIWAVKPGFSAVCASIGTAMRDRYGVKIRPVPFFDAQAARGDDGELERSVVARYVDRDPETHDRIAHAFVTGLASYHLILDGCHRSATNAQKEVGPCPRFSGPCRS